MKNTGEIWCHKNNFVWNKKTKFTNSFYGCLALNFKQNTETNRFTQTPAIPVEKLGLKLQYGGVSSNWTKMDSALFSPVLFK